MIHYITTMLSCLLLCTMCSTPHDFQDIKGRQDVSHTCHLERDFLEYNSVSIKQVPGQVVF